MPFDQYGARSGSPQPIIDRGGRRLTSVGLAQARPNYFKVANLKRSKLGSELFIFFFLQPALALAVTRYVLRSKIVRKFPGDGPCGAIRRCTCQNDAFASTARAWAARATKNEVENKSF